MNINILIDKLKKDIGMNGYLKKVYSDNVLRDSILHNSLETFNRFSGFYVMTKLEAIVGNWVGTNLGTNEELAYKIPDIIMDQFKELGVEIKGVALRQSNRQALPYLHSRGWQDDMRCLSYKHRQSINHEAPRVRFRAPDSIIINSGGSSFLSWGPMQYNISIECTHPRNLSTITKGLEQWFEDLCKYDILINLYNNDLRNLKIDLGSSSVDLQLENFQNAESDRRDLLQTIRQRAANDKIEILI